MNQYGEVLDKEKGVDTKDEEALALYKNMVCCQYRPHGLRRTCGLTVDSEHYGPTDV